MSPRVIALVLIVGGGVLLVNGLRSSKSATSQLSEAFNNRPSRETTALMVGGLSGIGLGVWMFLQSRKH